MIYNNNTKISVKIGNHTEPTLVSKLFMLNVAYLCGQCLGTFQHLCQNLGWKTLFMPINNKIIDQMSLSSIKCPLHKIITKKIAV